MNSRTIRTAGQGLLIGSLALIPLLLERSGDALPLSNVWFVPLGAAFAGAVHGAFWPKGESPKLRRRAWLLTGLAAVPTFVVVLGVPSDASFKWKVVSVGVLVLMALFFAWMRSIGEEAGRRAFPLPLFMEPPWDLIRQSLPKGFEPPTESVNVLLDLELDLEGYVARATATQAPGQGNTILVTTDRYGRSVVEPKLQAAPDQVAAAVASGFMGLRFQFENPDDAAEHGRFRMSVGVRPEDLRPSRS